MQDEQDKKSDIKLWDLVKNSTQKLKANNDYSFLELKPITGRKHQLRKQLYNIGNPIVGDKKYSISNKQNMFRTKNLFLHAYKIKFMINNKKYTYRALLPDYFKKLLITKKLKFSNN